MGEGALDAMSVDAGGPVNWHACHVEVRDAGGEIVLEFPFLETVEITGDRPH